MFNESIFPKLLFFYSCSDWIPLRNTHSMTVPYLLGFSFLFFLFNCAKKKKNAGKCVSMGSTVPRKVINYVKQITYYQQIEINRIEQMCWRQYSDAYSAANLSFLLKRIIWYYPTLYYFYYLFTNANLLITFLKQTTRTTVLLLLIYITTVLIGIDKLVLTHAKEGNPK